MRFKDGEKVLKRLSVPESDFEQIKAALRRTKYYTYDGNGLLKKIDSCSAICLIGSELFWSGIARSAFHWTAARLADNGAFVLFDSSALFR